jgi:phage virion morphogenesis protein
MSTVISIEVTGDDVQSALNELLKQIGDTRPAMRAISEVLLDSIEDAFDKEADPETGSVWEALSQVTIDQRKRDGKWPGKMLQYSPGGLASSFSANYGDEFAAASSNKPYAAIHHFGGMAGKNRKVKIPARRYAILSPSHREEVLDILQRYLGL